MAQDVQRSVSACKGTAGADTNHEGCCTGKPVLCRLPQAVGAAHRKVWGVEGVWQVGEGWAGTELGGWRGVRLLREARAGSCTAQGS